ncbi:hypothetical protein [Octadecabacter antarcticus]|uniref:hypothetical protein n=1 Tax=Octadecabacter antarcticus TaxID=1217908 RepID=UPI0003111F3B|nr:hypothetical protein [Octadecabacter antarcticus]
MAHRFGFIKTIAFQIGIAALCLVVFLVTVAAAMGLIQLLFGAWGLLVSPILLVMLPLIIAIIIGHLASLYREVLVV